MSFILDALKKAESERSRQAGPVLMDVRVAPTRQRLPLWAWLLVLVLLANLAVLVWVLLRRPGTAPTAPLPVSAQPVAPIAPRPAPAQPATDTAIVTAPAPLTVPAPVPVAESAPIAAPIPAATSATPAAAMTTPPRIDNLPTAAELIAQGFSLPTLQLNLHVYDEVPGNRYVLLNARRLREGDEVADGIRVESIVPRGVVLNARGRRFVLLAGG